MIDVYQATTQMTDESDQTYPFTINTLLDQALGPGLLRRVHREHAHRQRLEPAARTRSSPRRRRAACRSSRRGRCSTWLDGRNESSFDSISWSGNKLSFSVTHAAGANGLRGMVPTSSSVGDLSSITRNGTAVPTTAQTIKGAEYAFFDAAAGNYEAIYAVDETPPAISNVQTSDRSTGTATITWQTDEPADSRVDYGTSPSTLGSHESDSALTTSHSIHLTGLAPNTTYYYRATSTDAASNSSTEPEPPAAPGSFGTPGASFTDTTVSDFGAGTLDPNAYVSLTEDGEVILKPSEGQEFSGGPGLPSGWSSATWESEGGGAGGSATVSGGSLHVDGAMSGTTSAFGAGRSLEFVATFGAAAFQHVAFTDNFQSVWAMFSTRLSTSGQLYASTNTGTTIDTPVGTPGQYVGSAHRYRIQWEPGEVKYFIDGSLVHTDSASFATNLNVAASDFNSGGPELSVAWLHLSPYPSTATFNSRVFDAGQAVDWDGIDWNASTPTGTGVAVSVRTGETPTPDGSWGAFTTIPTSGGDIPGTSRYVQYRAVLSSSDASVTPALNEVTVNGTQLPPAPGAPTITGTQPTSPSSQNNPKVVGTVGSGSPTQVKIFENATCSGTATATGTVAEFTGQGIEVTVPSDSVTSLSAKAIGAGGESACSEGIGYREDSTPPDTQITSHPTTPSNSSGASFSFSGSDSGSGVASFECRLDAGSFAACTSPKQYSGLADGSHSFEVRAKDQAGNLDASPASFAWTIDTAAPDTQITAHPADPSSSANASFAFSGSDSGSGVASFQCRRDSSSAADWEACSSEKTYPALADGSHSFEVRAVDQAGNLDPTPASFTWTIDTLAPDTQITGHPAESSSSANASFSFSGSDGGSGVASFECRLDSGAFAACTSPKQYSGLADGSHSFEVRAKDQAGNLDASPASFAWTIDTTAPDTQLLTHPASPTSSTGASFSFSGSDGGSGVASFECRLDAGSFAACTSPKEYSGLADGSHSFEVRAKDQAGNLDASPASFTWTIDTAAPDTQITAHPADLSGRALPPSASRAATAARASPRSNAGSTPAPLPPAPRRSNTAASPTAPTASKCGPRIRPATSTPARRASPGRSTPPPPTPRSPPIRRISRA